MVKTYPCPNCGAGMTYDIQSGKLHCDHCDYSQEIESMEDAFETAEDTAEKTAGDTADDNQSSAGERIYKCVNCQGVLKLGPKDVTTTCEYCGSPLILTDRLQGDMRPEKVLPFKYTRESAVSAFRKWCHNGRFSPPGFMSAKNIQNLKPMYVPFWLYDTEIDADAQASATTIRTYLHGDMEVTETSFYEVSRSMHLSYEHVPYDASEKLDDTIVAKILPYDFSEMKLFKMPYLAGFEADQKDYSAEEMLPLVKQRLNGYSEQALRSTMEGYTTVNITSQNYDYDTIDSHYVYLPLWFISYRYREEDYIFAMNGQTGKVIGKPPISSGKVAMWFTLISAIIFAILMLLGVVL